MPTNLLAQLKDIHQPAAIGFWPLAPGWYIVIAFIIMASIVLLHFLYKRWLLRLHKRDILNQIDVLLSRYQHERTSDAVAQLSVLLRRVSLDCFPRKEVAGLHGDAWLIFLEQHCPTNRQEKNLFTTGVGRLLISAPYQSGTIAGADELFRLTKNWINVNL